MKKKCQHLRIDGWHVPTQEAREVVRASKGRPYGWRDQVRAEFEGNVSRWMWPGLLLLLTVGLVIQDWLLVVGAAAAILFFLYQAIALVRTLRAGDVVRAMCSEAYRADQDDDKHHEVWRGRVHLRKRDADVALTCPQCITALRGGTSLELMVVMDPDDPGNNWLVGFRQPE